MQVTIIPIIIGAFGTVTKGLLKGLEDLEVGGRVETVQTTTLLRMARILRRILETWGDLLSLKLHWKPSVNADVKNSKGVNNKSSVDYESNSDTRHVWALVTTLKNLEKSLEELKIRRWIGTLAQVKSNKIENSWKLVVTCYSGPSVNSSIRA